MTSLDNADPRVVLVHGAYADGSSWSEVIKRLGQAGITATAVQNPLTSLTDDIAHTRRVLARQRGPVILAGHSFAGTVIAAWRSKPAWYAVSRQDRTISPELQRFLAGRMHATTTEIEAGHLSLITHPEEVTRLIANAVQAVRAADLTGPWA